MLWTHLILLTPVFEVPCQSDHLSKPHTPYYSLSPLPIYPIASSPQTGLPPGLLSHISDLLSCQNLSHPPSTLSHLNSLSASIAQNPSLILLLPSGSLHSC